MNIQKGKGITKYGPGIQIDLTGDEVAIAIDNYLESKGVYINGPRTINKQKEYLTMLVSKLNVCKKRIESHGFTSHFTIEFNNIYQYSPA